MVDSFFKTRPYFIMGILNTTPDSFSDGGEFTDVEAAVTHAEQMVNNGVDIIDVGGESSRPGAKSISIDEEISRVIPVIKKIRDRFDVLISIDTVKSEVAKEALDAGAFMVNDISAGRQDTGMADLVASQNCFVTLMHSRKKPENMQDSPYYKNVVIDVQKELMDSVKMFESCGVASEKIIIDFGIGFSKRFEDNIDLLANTKKFTGLGYPVLIGTSRKSFIDKITNQELPKNRVAGSLASIAHAYLQGAKIFRVHDVRETVDFLEVITNIEAASE